VNRIVIRADAGSVPELGTGHIVRSIKLADALRQCPQFKNTEVLFATRAKAPFELGADLVRQANYGLIASADLEPNSQAELQSIVRSCPNIVILDRLETSAELVSGLKNAGIFVVTFDDLGLGRKYADLAINALLQQVDPQPNGFVGYDYLFSVSDEITQTKTRPIGETVFVSFGGFDHRQLNHWFLSLIPKINGPKHYHLVVSGLGSDALKMLQNDADTTRALAQVDVLVHQRPSDYFKILCASDLAVVSGGLTAFGCAQAGVPAIGVPQYHHQLENINRLDALGCLKCGTQGMALEPDLTCSLVTALSTDYTARLAMSQAGVKAIDGKGLGRAVDLIAKTYLRLITANAA
jgi:spore coat polysaccharide biosynthesis predicted glycosyltransferase SpsG